MTGLEATAEVFWTALKALPRKEQQAVLQRVLQDEKLLGVWRGIPSGPCLAHSQRLAVDAPEAN
jgi:hypothetical protein